jgi:UDP-N-acetylmuramyl pentapeptide phosphotransferase/UDP-N-acetylglucosamine-1-phosphate transferase
MSALFLAFAVSWACTILLVRSSKVHARLSLDSDTNGPQKFHATPVPRVGGVGIFAGVLAAMLLAALQVHDRDAWLGPELVACALPTFLWGLLEDTTKNVSPRRRLVMTALSAALAFWILDAAIVRTSIPGLDPIVATLLGAAAVTVFAVTGVANSINIIDGFNGLASMCVAIMLASIAYVAFEVGDQTVGVLALAGIGAILGFFLWNFPAGLIFLGDGGAYFLGFFVAELAILLLLRNPNVSPMFPLLVVIYPVFETVFSIYRRRWLRAVPPSMPDGIHLHSLVYRRLMRWAVGNRTAKALTRRNSMTSPYLWVLCMCSVVPAVLFWNNTPVLGGFIALFVVSYSLLYWRIVRFKTPRWLIFRR